ACRATQIATTVNSAIEIEEPDLRTQLQSIYASPTPENVLRLVRVIALLSAKQHVGDARLRALCFLDIGEAFLSTQDSFRIHYAAKETSGKTTIRNGAAIHISAHEAAELTPAFHNVADCAGQKLRLTIVGSGKSAAGSKPSESIFPIFESADGLEHDKTL